MSHLQSRGPGSQHTVIIVAGAIVVVVVINRAFDTTNQDEKDVTRKARIHNLLQGNEVNT